MVQSYCRCTVGHPAVNSLAATRICVFKNLASVHNLGWDSFPATVQCIFQGAHYHSAVGILDSRDGLGVSWVNFR